MNNDLLTNLDRIHTTELGAERIRRNINSDITDVIVWSKQRIENAKNITRKGKNWYVYTDDLVLTINAHSFTIITAHKDRKINISIYNLHLTALRPKEQREPHPF